MNQDIQQMGTLLSKMTAEQSAEFRLDESQIKSLMEIAVPRFATTFPGLPPGFKCSVEADERGWTIRVDRPEQ